MYRRAGPLPFSQNSGTARVHKRRINKGFLQRGERFCNFHSIPIAIHQLGEYSTVRRLVTAKPWKHHRAWIKHLTVDLKGSAE
jgi:hypothetical protein